MRSSGTPSHNEAVGVTFLKKVNNNCGNELLPIVCMQLRDDIISVDKHINLLVEHNAIHTGVKDFGITDKAKELLQLRCNKHCLLPW